MSRDYRDCRECRKSGDCVTVITTCSAALVFRISAVVTTVTTVTIVTASFRYAVTAFPGEERGTKGGGAGILPMRASLDSIAHLLLLCIWVSSSTDLPES